jgi:hypothetical protein
MSVNIAMLKLLSKKVEITKLKLLQPKGEIKQTKQDFNFTDLIEKFSKEKTDSTHTPYRFSIKRVKIVNGEFQYHESEIPIIYSIEELNINSKRVQGHSDSVITSFSFISGTDAGAIKGAFDINTRTKDYRLAVQLFNFDFGIANQYLKDFANYGILGGSIDADLVSIGNLNNANTATNKGNLTINDLHFGKNSSDVYASVSKLFIRIIEVSPSKLVYLYDSITVSQPFIKYEKYDSQSNFETVFGKDWENIKRAQADTMRFNLVLEIVDYLKQMGKNLLKSDFKINHFSVEKGAIEFTDYTQNEKFKIKAHPLCIIADSIYKSHRRVNIDIKSGIKPFGNFNANLHINPKDSSNFEMFYSLKGVPLSIFNPYTITQTSYPIDRGTLNLNGNWNVRDWEIKSNNHLVVTNPRVGKILRSSDAKWIPLPLILRFVREKGNVIDFEIPITGTLKDPKFNWGDVLKDVLRNIFVKSTSTAYNTSVSNTAIIGDEPLSLKWEIRQSSMYKKQEQFVEKIAKILLNNPRATIDIFPVLYADKESEHICFFEAKKKYFLFSKASKSDLLTRKDSIKIEEILVRDPSFSTYLNKETNSMLLFTLQDKCMAIVGQANVNIKLQELNKDREKTFLYPFKQLGVDKRVRIHPVETTIPYSGHSHYIIVYK